MLIGTDVTALLLSGTEEQFSVDGEYAFALDDAGNFECITDTGGQSVDFWGGTEALPDLAVDIATIYELPAWVGALF